MTDPKRVMFDRPQTQAEIRAAAGKRVVKRNPIPELPPLDIDPQQVRKPDQRAVACVNLRLAGTPFHEIAKQLEYVDASAAKAAYFAALASTNPPEDWETLRQTEVLRAEAQLRRSTAMASAAYLVVHRTAVEEDGTEVEVEEHIPNVDQLRWHEQAGKDLALHAMISGAKAPTRLEVSADTQELNQMVQVLLQKHGEQRQVEANIFDLDVIDAEEVPDGPEPRED